MIFFNIYSIKKYNKNMKYVKTFESFKLNESQDMMFMPVDPIKGSVDVLSDIWDTVGEYVEEGKEWFQEKLKKFVDLIIKSLDIKEIIKKIEVYFGMDVHDLTIKNAFEILMSKNKNLVKESNEVEEYKNRKKIKTIIKKKKIKMEEKSDSEEEFKL